MSNQAAKSYLILSFLLLIGSCSKNDIFSSTYLATFELMFDYFVEEDLLFTQELINDIPYASSLLSFDKKNQSLIILETKKDDQNFWISRDRVRFKEENGRIIQSIGLPNDLYSIERPKISFLDILAEDDIDYITYYSFRNPTLSKLKVFVTAKVLGPEKVKILDTERELVLVEERIFSDKINWRAKNKFWIDPKTGFVWMSNQTLTPKLPSLRIQVTKKPAY